ncbi:MAG TPA: hypothetical protein VKU02_25825 [Gemmataceae bacterium]|nr:hypothetical protein [Gemmataceae bacterium]
MSSRSLVRLGLCAAVAVSWSVVPLSRAESEAKKFKTEYFKGKVVPLAKAVEKFGVQLDADAGWLVLLGDDGKIYPLIKDDGSRMFFKDTRLLNRPMRLTGRLLPGSQLLQVVEIHSYNQKNELQEVYYWCDICTIKRYEKKLCDCCGAPMELREVPVRK